MGTIDARLSVGLPHHPKTKKLIRRLGHSGAWHLVCLMLWAAQNRSNGELDGMDQEDIEVAAGWEGEEGAFVKALVDVRFLDDDGGHYSIHNWERHNPWAAGAEARSERARWAAICKQHGPKKAAEIMPEYAARLLVECPDSAPGMLDACAEGARRTRPARFGSAPSPSPSPNPSQKDSLGREDYSHLSTGTKGAK